MRVRQLIEALKHTNQEARIRIAWTNGDLVSHWSEIEDIQELDDVVLLTQKSHNAS